MRRFLHAIAILSLLLFGPVQGMRAPEASHACDCGCGASTEDQCPCGMPKQTEGSCPAPKGCPQPAGLCFTNPAAPRGLASQAPQAKLAAPRKEPAPWPAVVEAVNPRMVGAALDGLAPWASPPGALQRQAILSIFRI